LTEWRLATLSCGTAVILEAPASPAESRSLKSFTNLASCCQNYVSQGVYSYLFACSVEGANGKFASRQRAPFIAVHRTELAGEIEQNVCKFFCAFGFPMKVKIINA
jgi:hypothetical protein